MLLISLFAVMIIFIYDVITIYYYLMASVLHFTQPVVDAFDPRLLVAPPIFHGIDFMKIKVRITCWRSFLLLVAIYVSHLACGNPFGPSLSSIFQRKNALKAFRNISE